MAEDIQSNIRIGIDTAGAAASLSNLQRQISVFQTQLSKGSAKSVADSRQLTNDLVNNINATNKFAAQIKTIRTTTESFTTALEKNKLSMGEYFRYAGASTKTFGSLFKTEFDTINKVARERVKDLQTQYIKLGRDANGAMRAIAVRPLVLDMDNLATKTAIAAQRQQLLNQLLKQGSTNLLNFGKNTQWAGRQLMVGFTVPLTMLGTTAAKTFMDMEKQVIQLKRVYGDMNTTIGETNKMVGQMRGLANEFTKYGVSASSTMELAASAAAMGKTGNDLLAQVAQANKLAVLGNVDQQKALETTISLTNAFGSSTKELSSNINFLNAVENQTVTSIEDLTTAIPKAGPVVKQLGGNVQDLAFFLTAMKEGGINASEGANALKSGLASMINPTKKASEFLAGFGINLKGIVESDKGNVKQTVIDFATALNKLDPLNRARAIEQLFGKFQFARISTLFQNVVKQGTQAQTVLGLTKATTEELAILSEREMKKISDSPMFKFQKAVEDIKVSLIPLGEAFLKLATPIVKFGKDVLDKFNAMDSGAKNFIVGLTTAVGVIGPVALMAFGLLANGVANIIKLFANLKSMFNGAGKATGDLATDTGYLTQLQIEQKSVAASLDQVHNKLTQTLTSEASALSELAGAYERTAAAQSRMTGTPATMVASTARTVMKKATGGLILGPGSGTSDSIPAMVSNGEFIMPAAQTRKYAGLLNAMIANQIPGYSRGKTQSDSDGPDFRREKSKTRSAPKVYDQFRRGATWDTLQEERTIMAQEIRRSLEASNVPEAKILARIKSYVGDMKDSGIDISHIDPTDTKTVKLMGRDVSVKNWKSKNLVADNRGINQYVNNLENRKGFFEKLDAKKIAESAGVSQAIAKREIAKLAAGYHPTTESSYKTLAAIGRQDSGYGGSYVGPAIAKAIDARLKTGDYFAQRKAGKLTPQPSLDAPAARAADRNIANVNKRYEEATAKATATKKEETKAVQSNVKVTKQAVNTQASANKQMSASVTKTGNRYYQIDESGKRTRISEEAAIKAAAEEEKRIARSEAAKKASATRIANAEAKAAATAEAAAAIQKTGLMSRMGTALSKVSVGKAAMAVSGATMAATMIPGQLGQTAQDLAMPLMGVATAFQMLPPQIAIAATAIGALGLGVYSLVKTFNDAQDKSAQLAASLGSGADAMIKFSTLNGAVSAGDVMSRRRSNATSMLSSLFKKDTYGDKFLSSQEGTGLVSSASSGIVSQGVSKTAAQIALQLSNAVAQGVLKPTQAQQIAESLGKKLNDTNLALSIKGDLVSLIGPNGEDLTKDNMKIYVDLINSGNSNLLGVSGNTSIARANSAYDNNGGLSRNGEVLKNGIIGYAAGGAVGAIANRIAPEMSAKLAAKLGQVGVGLVSRFVAREATAAVVAGATGIETLGVGAVLSEVGAVALTAVDVYNSIKDINEQIGAGTGAFAAESKDALNANQANIDAMDLAYQKRRAELQLNKDSVNLAILDKNYTEQKTKALEANNRTLAGIANNYKNASTGFMGVGDVHGAMDTAIEKQLNTVYKGQEDKLKVTLDNLKNSGANQTQQYVLKNLMASKQFNLTQGQSFVDIFGGSAKDTNTGLGMVNKLGGAFTGQALDLANVMSNTKDKKQFLASFKLDDPQGSAKKLQDFQDIVKLSPDQKTAELRIKYLTENGGKAMDEYQNNLVKLADLKKAGKLSYKSVLSQIFHIDSAGMQNFKTNDAYFKTLKPSQKVTYLQEFVSLMSSITDAQAQSSYLNNAGRTVQDFAAQKGSAFRVDPATLAKEKARMAAEQAKLDMQAMEAAGLLGGNTGGNVPAGGTKKDPFADFIKNATASLILAQQQLKVRNLLIAAGWKNSEAIAASNDAEFVAAYSAAKTAKKQQEVIDLYKKRKAATEALIDPETKLQNLASEAEKAFSAQEKMIELKYKALNKADNATINSAQNAVSALQYQQTNYESGLTRIGYVEDEINKKYEARYTALDQIDQAQQNIADAQSSQLDIAQAISRGDIGAAAKAVQDMRAKQADKAAADRRTAMQNAQKAELAAVSTTVDVIDANGKVSQVVLTRSQIEAKSLEIQKQILGIQDSQLRPAERRIALNDILMKAESDWITTQRDKWAEVEGKFADASTKLTDYIGLLKQAEALSPGNSGSKPSAEATIAYNNAKTTIGDPKANYAAKRDAQEIISAYQKAYKVADGGHITGPGSGTSDSIPAWLSNGEYVIKASAVKQIGVSNLDAMNNAPKFASGGHVGHAPFIASNYGAGAGGATIGSGRSVSKAEQWWAAKPAPGAPLDKWYAQGAKLGLNQQKQSEIISAKQNLPSVQKATQDEIIKKGSTFRKIVSNAFVTGYVADAVARGFEGKFDAKEDTAGLLFTAAVSRFGLGAVAKDIGKYAPLFGKDAASTYAKTNVKLGDNLIPTYTVGSGRFAFQGQGQDFSKLGNMGINVVPTTPEGILKAALKINPKNKSTQTMLKNLQAGIIGKKELELLDGIAASVSIGKGGKVLGYERTDGFSQIVDALSGNKTAKNAVALKTKKLKEVVAGNAARAKAANKNFNGGPDLENLVDQSTVPVIHSTKYPVQRDKDGNVFLQPHGAHNPEIPQWSRASTHFTLEDTVKSHLFGSWSDTNNKIVSPLSSMIRDNGNPSNLRSIDTWWMSNPGQSLKISDSSVIRPYTNSLMYADELVKRGLLKPGKMPPPMVVDPATRDVLHITKPSYNSVDRLQLKKLLGIDVPVGAENAAIERLALQKAKQQIGINTPGYSLEQWGLNDSQRDLEITNTARKLGAGSQTHPGSISEALENPIKNDQTLTSELGNRASISDSMEALRFAVLRGKFSTFSKNIATRPNSWLEGSRGGLVAPPKYFASGGFARGTDTIPAMLTPGEFVVKKSAVDNIGVDNLRAINNGASLGGDSVYNSYNLSVNVRSDANPDDIARTVMTQIRQIDSQRLRSNRF